MFSHLPPREAAIAAYIDRLPDGADISVKTLAKVLPFGQCALRTALNNLQRAGHLRRGKEHVRASNSARWVTRTWFSRKARDDEWWTAFASGGPLPSPEKTETPRKPEEKRSREKAPEAQDEPNPPPPASERSRPFKTLARLGLVNPQLSLSSWECATLAPLVAQWFERGVDETNVVHALTAGLPPLIHSPAAFTRRRLTDKLPPERAPEPARPRPALRVLECAKCRAPGRPEALPGGICAPCRGEPPAPRRAPLTPAEVRAQANRARAASARTREGTRA
jgi:hypothetical protein